MDEYLHVKMLGWEEIRSFLVIHKAFNRTNSVEKINSETYDAIVERRTSDLAVTLRHELSIFIAGYLYAGE